LNTERARETVTWTATILLVEDNIDDYDAAMRSFKAAHLNNPVHWCKTGKNALDYLRHEGDHAREPRGETPALIVLDPRLPPSVAAC
jgi:two-component system response regulator